MEKLFKISDEQLIDYLLNGYLILNPKLPSDFNDAMYEAACKLHDEAKVLSGNANHLHITGDNLRARIPIIERVLKSNMVHGALSGILGNDYVLHPHHFVHESNQQDQNFHQDATLPWNERGHYRTHRPNWAMLFYYPQDVTIACGPTEILSGSQYTTKDYEKEDGSWSKNDYINTNHNPDCLYQKNLKKRDEYLKNVVKMLNVKGVKRKKLLVKSGSIVLCNYDIYHRGARKTQDSISRRFMYKFWFFRRQDPVGPTWENLIEHPFLKGSSIDGVVEYIWHWMRGNKNWAPKVIEKNQIDLLREVTSDDLRIKLAYEIGFLARSKKNICDEIGQLLKDEKETVRRSAGFALGLTGQKGEKVFLEAIRNNNPSVRRVAVLGASEARLTSAEAIESLFQCLESDEDDLVRSNAAYALGNIARVTKISSGRLISRLDLNIEPDNSNNHGLKRSTIRENIAYAINNMTLGEADLNKVAKIGLTDHDRYVRGLTLTTLERHAKQNYKIWLQNLIDHLSRFQYN